MNYDEDVESAAIRARLRSIFRKAMANLPSIQEHQSQIAEFTRWVELVRLLRPASPAKKARPTIFKTPIARKTDDKASEDEALLQQLSPFNFQQLRRELLNHNYHHTQRWFLTSPQFTSWTQGKHWHLRCYGAPSCGKTTLLAVVSRDLQDRAARDDEVVATVTMFLASRDNLGNLMYAMPDMSLEEICLRTTLRQLIEAKLNRQRPSATWQKLSASTLASLKVSVDELKQFVQQELVGFDKVYLLVDGLEHCPMDIQDEITAILSNLGITRVLLFGARFDCESEEIVTCDVPGCGLVCDLFWYCEDCPPERQYICDACISLGSGCAVVSHTPKEPYSAIEVQLRTLQEDLIDYVKKRLEKDIQDNDSLRRDKLSAREVLRNVEETVIYRSNGVFIFAKLFLDYLANQQELDQILDRLDRMPKHEIDYFDELIRDVRNQPNHKDADLGLTSLILVATSLNYGFQICYDQLCDALKEFDHRRIRFNWPLTPRRLLNATNGMILIGDLPDRSISTFHPDLVTYINDELYDAADETRPDLAMLCLQTLMHPPEEPIDCVGDVAAIQKNFTERPFLKYALRHWGNYVRTSESAKLQEAVLDFFRQYDQYGVGLQQMSLVANGEAWAGTDKLHLLALFDLTNVFRALHEREPALQVDVRDTLTGRTPAIVAARRGNLEILQELRLAGADFSQTCSAGHSVLCEAILAGDISIARYVIDAGNAQDLNTKIMDGKTALMLCLEEVKLYNSDVAAEVLGVLLARKDVELSYRDKCGRTALHMAAEAGMLDALSKMAARDDFEHILNVVEDNDLGRNALMALAESKESNCSSLEDRVHAFKLLIDHGASLEYRDKQSRSLLHYVARKAENIPLLDLLIAKNLDVNVQDGEGWTALHTACAYNCPRIAQQLLEAGANPISRDAHSNPPYRIAELYGGPEILSIFPTETMTTPIAEEAVLHRPLWSQICTNCEDLSHNHNNLAATTTVDQLQAADAFQFTALHYAVERASQPDLVLALLERDDVDVNARNIHGQTPFHLVFKCADDDLLWTLFQSFLDSGHGPKLDLDVADVNGDRPLDLALRTPFASSELLAFRLIEEGAQIALPNVKIQELLEIALQESNTIVVERLSDAGGRLFEVEHEWIAQTGLCEDEDLEDSADAQLLMVLERNQTKVLSMFKGYG